MSYSNFFFLPNNNQDETIIWILLDLNPVLLSKMTITSHYSLLS